MFNKLLIKNYFNFHIIKILYIDNTVFILILCVYNPVF